MGKKKILYFMGHARCTREWGMLGEIIKTLQDNSNNDVFYLDCDNAVSGYCWLTENYHLGYCSKCLNNCRKVLKHLKFPKEKCLKMRRYKVPKIPTFRTIQEALDYEFDGYHIAFGAISCLMTALRDYSFDVFKYRTKLRKFIISEYTALKNIEELHKTYNFDEIHIFNGRFTLNHALVEFAQKHNISFLTYEFGSNIHKYRIDISNVLHDFYYTKQLIQKYWDNAPADKNKIAEKWFEDRRAGKYQAIESFTKNQIKNYLPSDFDLNKENIVFFNSSTDEMAAFSSWKQPFFERDNQVIEAMLKYYENDTSKHFYLRVHPNLTKAKRNKTTQIKEINELKLKYKNLTVIEPDEKVDTYALIDAASKVVTCTSTVGCEATYWGNISILAGKSLYEDDDCAYRANSFEELFLLIDNKNLMPKPKKNSYKFAYYNQTNGIEFKYLKLNTLKSGEILDLKLKG